MGLSKIAQNKVEQVELRYKQLGEYHYNGAFVFMKRALAESFNTRTIKIIDFLNLYEYRENLKQNKFRNENSSFIEPKHQEDFLLQFYPRFLKSIIDVIRGKFKNSKYSLEDFLSAFPSPKNPALEVSNMFDDKKENE